MTGARLAQVECNRSSPRRFGPPLANSGTMLLRAARAIVAPALAAAGVVLAWTTSARSAEEEETQPAPAPRLEYSQPFLLRSVLAATALRSDSSFGFYENANASGGFAYVSELTGMYRIPGTGTAKGTGLAPFLKLAVVEDWPPGTAKGGFAIVNPLVGACYALKLGDSLRASASLGITVPVGMGGGNSPDAGALDARTVGPVLRAGMENSIFAVNDLAVIP